ncbi:MAG: ADP-ribosylglycohydrolase family protein [Candidatus Rifleibacteriota bacterium]
MNLQEKFSGCLVGLACGDAFGAPYEGGIVERLLWQLIGRTFDGRKRFTDDTQMSIDLARSILACEGIDQPHLASQFADGYRWSRGYGPGAAYTLRLIKKGNDWRSAAIARYPGGSFGNGAAMRAPVVAMLTFGLPRSLAEAVKKVSEITHAHPAAIEGAILIATAVQCSFCHLSIEDVKDQLFAAASTEVFKTKLALAFSWLEKSHTPGIREIVNSLGNGIAAVDSCVTAIFCALCNLNEPFPALLKLAADCGGDVDTIGSMAGAIWGAFNGLEKIGPEQYRQVEQIEGIIRLAEEIFQLNQRLKCNQP